MSTNPSSQTDPNVIQEWRKELGRLFSEIAQLSELQLTPAEYYAEFLQRVLSFIGAPAGAIWGKTAGGHLQMQYQIGLQEIGLEQIDNARESHSELLRQVMQQGRPLLVPPRSGPGGTAGSPTPANLTGFVLLLAPIIIEKQVAGVLEAWQDPDRRASVQPKLLGFLARVADFVSAYIRNTQLRQMLGQQSLWSQLESYSRQIHGSLNPREVAYLVVNEGRRLIEADRVSVAVRQGSHTSVEAISGADVIQKRSSQVQCLRRLFDQVLIWGEKLVYTGAKDDSLPPKVIDALDAYLAESSSKVLMVMPLRDEREAESKKPCRSALMIECFEPSAAIEQLSGRMDVVCRHAAPALYNAVEHRRIPFRWILEPLAKAKESLRGKRLAQVASIAAGIVLLIALLCVVPYPLRMDAQGGLQPKERQIVYPQLEGRIIKVLVRHGDPVQKGQELLRMEYPQQMVEINNLTAQVNAAVNTLADINKRLNQNIAEEERVRLRDEQIKKVYERDIAQFKRDLLLQQTKPLVAPAAGKVVTFDLDQRLEGKTVKPGEPLLMVARTDAAWEYEVRIPERHVGQVRDALARVNGKPLRVDIKLAAHPTRTYYGWLHRDGVSGQATMHENEPVVLARVEIAGVEEGGVKREDLNEMPVGNAVQAKIHCGRRAVGYVWFYELWEFFYEHVIF